MYSIYAMFRVSFYFSVGLLNAGYCLRAWQGEKPDDNDMSRRNVVHGIMACKSLFIINKYMLSILYIF